MSKWRKKYAIHPAADIFPPMDDAELRELGEDIRKNGLRETIKFRWIYPDGKQKRQLYDGRNRLEAMESSQIFHFFTPPAVMPRSLMSLRSSSRAQIR
jgi:hypothetical protein